MCHKEQSQAGLYCLVGARLQATTYKHMSLHHKIDCHFVRQINFELLFIIRSLSCKLFLLQREQWELIFLTGTAGTEIIIIIFSPYYHHYHYHICNRQRQRRELMVKLSRLADGAGHAIRSLTLSNNRTTGHLYIIYISFI